MRVRIVKLGDGKFTVHCQKTRHGEKRVMPEVEIPKEQVGEAVGVLANKMRPNGPPTP